MRHILYNILTIILFTFLLPLLPFIYLFSSKRRANMLQRLGWIHLISKKNSKSNSQSYPELNPHKKRIWLHALSVGEMKSALPLVNALKNKYLNNENYELIITASTRTGFDMAHELFSTHLEKNNQPDSHLMSVQVGYFPFDLPFSVKSICSRIEPDLVIIVESDLWPGFLWYMERKKIPVFLVNARLSQSSFNGYMTFRKIGLFSSIFSLFEKIMVQTEIDKERFLKIGVAEEKVILAGNIKFDQPTPKTDIPDLDKFKNYSLNLDKFRHQTQVKAQTHVQNHAQKYIIAGSTHQGEEEVIGYVFKELKQKPEFKDIKLIIAPRDPKRSADIKKRLTKQIKNINCNFFSVVEQDKIIDEDIIIIDKMGILAALYSICDIAFIGGSLVPCGGHNPLGPAIFSKPVIFGHHNEDFKEISETMISNNAAFKVKDSKELIEIITMLLNDRDSADRLGRNGKNLIENGRGAVDKILYVIFQTIEGKFL